MRISPLRRFLHRRKRSFGDRHFQHQRTTVIANTAHDIEPAGAEQRKSANSARRTFEVPDRLTWKLAKALEMSCTVVVRR